MSRLLLLLPLLLLIGCGPRTQPTMRMPAPELDFPIGPFSLTERSGKKITEKDLAGKVWIASFVFTRCTGPCPSVTATMRRLQSDLADQPDVMFVTFTVDPARDDLAALKKYADFYQADPKRWLFLTGDEKAMHDLIQGQFKQSAVRREGPDVKAGDEFAHSTRLAIVDKKGVMRATFPGVREELSPVQQADEHFEEVLKELKQKVAALVAE